MSVVSNRINTTIATYLKGQEDAVKRKHAFWAMVQSRSRMVKNAGGENLTWVVTKARHEMTTNNGEQALTFSQPDQFERAQLEWKGYAATSLITQRQKMLNKGEQALVKLAGEEYERLMDSMRVRVAEEIYNDASATGKTARYDGLETMFAATQSLNITDGTARTADAADLVMYPNDTYAGLATNLGYYGDSWDNSAGYGINSTWPFGRGGYTYDFWTPVILAWDSTALGGSAQTWKVQGESAIRRLIGAVNGRNGAEDAVDLALLQHGMFIDLKELYSGRERINVENSELRKFGIKDSLMLDGVEVVGDYGIPGQVGYVLSMDAVTVYSLHKQLFHSFPVDWDLESQTDRLAVRVDGNFKFKTPKRFGKLVLGT